MTSRALRRAASTGSLNTWEPDFWFAGSEGQTVNSFCLVIVNRFFVLELFRRESLTEVAKGRRYNH